jgi:hypothetical protein
MGICVSPPPLDLLGKLISMPIQRPAYIAGVTNPIFESSRAWDLLLVIGAGTVTVAKDIHVTYPVSGNLTLGAPLVTRTGTLKAESSFGSEDDGGRVVGGKEGVKNDFVTKMDNNADKIFIEDVGVSSLSSSSTGLWFIRHIPDTIGY